MHVGSAALVETERKISEPCTHASRLCGRVYDVDLDSDALKVTRIKVRQSGFRNKCIIHCWYPKHVVANELQMAGLSA